MDNTCQEQEELIKMDIKNETINDTLIDLRTQIKFLRNQNDSIKMIIEEENKKGFEMTNLLRARRPFNRTKTGELIFPGKKEMEFKLDIMTKEILKLKSILDCFQKDRCKIESTRKIFKSITCLDMEENTEDITKIELVRTLDKKYNNMREEFDEKILVISKYRVKFDVLKNEFNAVEKRLQETQMDYNEFNKQIAKLEMDESDTHEKTESILKNKLNDARQRLNGLNSVEDYQMDELKDKKKLYMKAIHEKEYQTIRANNLCKEKDRMTAEFEIEFNRVKEYYKKRLQHVENCPTTLQALQGKLSIQKELKTSVERTIDIISRKLKSILGNTCSDSNNSKSKILMNLKARNIGLKKRLDEMEVILCDIQKRCNETKRKTNEQKHRLDNLHNETLCKIKEIRDILRGPTEQYLRTMDKLENQISKIEAYACFEDGKTKLVTSMMQDQITGLANILKNAQEQITEIQSLQNYLEATQTILCKVLDCKVFKFN